MEVQAPRFDGTGAIELNDFGFSSTLSAFAWLVPGFALGLPGLIVLLIVGLQMATGIVFVPLTRRFVGDARRARRTARRSPSAN